MGKISLSFYLEEGINLDLMTLNPVFRALMSRTGDSNFRGALQSVSDIFQRAFPGLISSSGDIPAAEQQKTPETTWSWGFHS